MVEFSPVRFWGGQSRCVGIVDAIGTAKAAKKKGPYQGVRQGKGAEPGMAYLLFWPTLMGNPGGYRDQRL
jgi:hypothetical protein